MRAFFLIQIFCILFCSSQSTSSSETSFISSTDSVTTSKFVNSSPTSSPSGSIVTSGSYGSSDSSAGSTNPSYSTTSDPDSLNLNDVEKLVTYTTKQKTIFIASCGGTFVLLIALAILSGLSDTIARSRQKTTRTHA